MTTLTNHHHHADELLEDYLLGTLPAADVAWMQEHLERCPRCQAELRPLLGAVQALPFGAPEPDVQMSDDLWSRIESAVTSSPTGSPEGSTIAPPPAASDTGASSLRSTPPTPITSRSQGRPWLMIAALMVLSLLGGAVLGQALPQFGNNDPETQRIAIEFTDPSITANGELIYLPEEEVFVLEVQGMPEPPEGYVYQAWLIDENAPVPVGVMNTDTGEFASAGDRDAFQAFAITLESGPLGNTEPTSDPIMVAQLHDAEES